MGKKGSVVRESRISDAQEDFNEMSRLQWMPSIRIHSTSNNF